MLERPLSSSWLLYSFDVRTGESLSVDCQNRAGSGVRHLTVEVRDRNEQVLAHVVMTQTTTASMLIYKLTVTATTNYLRLSNEAQDPEVVGNWVRCSVFSVFTSPSGS